MKIKKIIRAILKPLGIWWLLGRIKHGGRFRIRWRARKFAPVFGKQKLIVKKRYAGKNHALSASAEGQELFITEKLLDNKTGFFVEVGGNDPVFINNTYALEKMGWKGISFEPVDFFWQKWGKSRTTKCYPYVLGDEETWVDFREIDGKQDGLLSGMSSVAGYGYETSLPHSSVIVKKQMRKLENVLSENSITDIDILFIDVEGFELNVLKGINFDRINIRCICIEVNGSLKKETYDKRCFLSDKGYVLKAHIGMDDIFIKKDLLKSI